jgi:phosphomevalonate kinase
MRSFATSAPGKVVLFGEYAVLFGAPALVAAIDRRAVVRLVDAPGDSYEVTAPGLATRTALFDIGGDGAPEWHEEVYGRRHFGLIDRIIQNSVAREGLLGGELPSFAATLDTRAFFETLSGRQVKLGLGSSAALTVALASALEGWAGVDRVSETDLDQLQAMVDLHRRVQGGVGSGVDVAASLLGGIIRYRLADDGAVANATRLELPGDLQTVYVWTARTASTSLFLKRLRLCREEAPGDVEPVLDELGTVSASGVAALAAGDTGAFLEEVDAFWRVLGELGSVTGMPIISEEHRDLHRAAEESGVLYKPSGAGGGDLGVGFTADPSAAARLVDRAASMGFRVLDLRVDITGLAGPGP